MTSALMSVVLVFTSPAPICAPQQSLHGGVESSAVSGDTVAPHWTLNRKEWAWPPQRLGLSAPTAEPISISAPGPSSSTPFLDFTAVSFARTESPAPPAAPPTTTLPPPKTPAELVDEIFGWPGRQLVTCESAWNQWAVGPQGERGLLQIHPVHRYGIVAQLGYSWDDMFQWEPNLRVGVEIRRVQGLRAWACWKG